MNRLKDKVAIITGSTSGIGAAMARLFGREGATVVICGRREKRGNALAQEIKKNGGKAMYHFLDLTQPETITALFADTKEKLGKIDILVNNAAAIGLPDGTVEEVTPEMWDAIFQSDLRGAFIATREVLPYLKENGGGSIVNIGSMASCGGDLGATAYSAAKALPICQGRRGYADQVCGPAVRQAGRPLQLHSSGSDCHHPERALPAPVHQGGLSG